MGDTKRWSGQLRTRSPIIRCPIDEPVNPVTIETSTRKIPRRSELGPKALEKGGTKSAVVIVAMAQSIASAASRIPRPARFISLISTTTYLLKHTRNKVVMAFSPW